jgi:heme-degrading monooxygenase HmoA
MHVQIITFQLKDLSEEEYSRIANEVAPAFADVPGLLSKVWLANSTTGTYGGAYFWSDRQAMEEFAKTELFNTVESHPNLANITSADFAVMDEPTKVTRGFRVTD